MDFILFPTKNIKALELVFPNHLINLADMVEKSGFISHPLIVEKENNIVLDGSHRHILGLLKGYSLLPVLFVDYDDPDIRVGTRLIHRHVVTGPINISKAEVMRRGITGDLFPPRTTRHFFPFPIPEVNVSLDQLGRCEEVCVEKNIADVSVLKEISHNKGYISELEEETDAIIQYLARTRETKKYLQEQVRRMEECL